MTLGTLEIKKAKKGLKTPSITSSPVRRPMSGKEVILRLKGLLSVEEADRLERNINESCEQLDD
jgi:hypothetical protein